MSRPGLSYEQAPPFGLPLRFFLSAPLFLLATALAAVSWVDVWTVSRWNPESVALTHLVTLGFLGQVMMGALLQMLPVLIGSPVPWPRLTGGLGYLGLTAGTPLLAAGLGLGRPTLALVGMAFLTAGWMPFLVASAVSLVRARAAATTTLYPMCKAWAALLLTLILGIWLGGGLVGLWPSSAIMALTGVHAAWGLLGWVLILVIGVAYQVVPMLQITPSYPGSLTHWLTWVVLAGITLLSFPASLGLWAAWAGWLLAGTGAIVFAWVTLDLLRRRRRKLADTTLDFWRLGMASLILLVPQPFIWPFLPSAWQDALETTAGIIFLLGFAVSVVSGMLYKIVPFLAWFHLQTQTGAKAGTIPNMKEFIADQRARWHLRLHALAVLCLLPAPWLPASYAIPGLALLGAAASMLWINLLSCTRLFRRYGGRLM